MKTIVQVLTVSLLAGLLVFAPNADNEVSAFEQTHIVSEGESLWKISSWYNVPLNEVRSLNHIWSNYIYPGQAIAIPTGTQTTQEDNFQRLQVSEYERDLIARGVYSEARGEPYEGQVAVASVIISRVLDNRWPGNVEGVIFEPWAFTPVHDGQFWLTPDATAYNAVDDALNGWDPSFGATFFYNPQTATSDWIFTRNTITHIGSHRFAY